MRKDKPLKKRLKAKASLSYKLTAYFVLFGVIIGYAVFLFTTAYNGHNMLQLFTEATASEIDFTDFNLEDFNERQFAEELHGLITSIEVEELPIQEVNAYIYSEDGWQKFSFIGHEIRTKSVYDELNPKVTQAIENNISYSGNLFLGVDDETTVYFNVPVPEGSKLVISATLVRSGVATVVKEQSSKLLFILLILVSVSFILGRLFSNTITKPLKKLSVNALKISEGEQDVKLPMKRRDEIGVLSRILDQMNGDLQERLKAMEIMNKIDKSVLSSISRNDLLNRVIGFVCDYIDKSTAVMALRDNKGGGYELISAISRDSAVKIANPYIPDELLNSKTIEDFKTPCVFAQDKNLTEVLMNQLHLPENIKRFYNVPLYLRESYLGSLLVIKEDQQPFTDEQQQTLRKLGDQVGVAMQSVMAVEEMNSLQRGAIQALGRSIDAKSRWTAGHSERVGELSELLGEAMGMDKMQLRRLTTSALLHDIGKIGISEAILDKPGRLTDEEFDLIKQHPQLGYEISRSIPDYEDICDGIRYHHERWNGTGYPLKRKGQDIPLFGRIIAIADVFDALSADRPYRTGLSFDECIQFIEDKKGIDFDAELAELFIETMKNPNNHLNNPEDRLES